MAVCTMKIKLLVRAQDEYDPSLPLRLNIIYSVADYSYDSTTPRRLDQDGPDGLQSHAGLRALLTQLTNSERAREPNVLGGRADIDGEPTLNHSPRLGC